MPQRSLVLTRERLATLESDELVAVAGAISTAHPLCALTSLQHSYCHSCGFGCTIECPTHDCH